MNLFKEISSAHKPDPKIKEIMETKSAREYWKEKFNEYPQTDSDKLAVAMMQEYASQQSAEATKELWIDVKQERPMIGKVVNLILLHHQEEVYSGFRANGGWYVFQVGEPSKYYIPNGTKEAEITHWKALPETPTK
jgi:hypothetical protein